MSDLIKRLFRSVSAAVVEKTISTTALKYTLSKIKDKFALKSEAVKNIAANGVVLQLLKLMERLQRFKHKTRYMYIQACIVHL